MWKLLVLAAAISIASGGVTRLGTKKCTYGPAYWCSKYSHAVECKAVEHCKNNVWKTVEQGSECDTCKEVLQYMHAILADNVTQGLLIDAIEEVCNLFPSSSAAECKSLITTYGTEIVQVIAAYTSNPNELCSLMGLCTAMETTPFMKLPEAMKPILSRLPFFGPGPVIPQSHQTSVSSSVECVVCEFVMEKLDTFITSKSTEAEIEAAVDKVCSMLPSAVQNDCLAFVNTYGAQIIHLIVHGATPHEICKFLGVCSFTVAVLDAPKKQAPKAGVFCEVCELAMGYLKNELSSNATEMEIIQAVDSLCNDLPSSYKSTCDSLVSNYGKEIISLLLAELSPDLICKELGLCASTNVKQSSGSMKKATKSVKSGELCLVCQVAMGFVKTELQNNNTEAAVVAMIDSVCSYLPSAFATECQSIITEYGEELIQLLMSDFNPEDVCKELHLCTTSGVKTMITAAMTTDAKQVKPKTGEFCQVCEVAMGYLKSVLSSESTEDEIINALETMCDAIPSSFKSECDSLVKTYGKEILNLLISTLSPDTLCKDLGLCTSNLSKKYQSGLKYGSKKAVASGALCEVCDLAMGYLKSTLSQPATEQEITKAMETLCTALPSSVRKECDGLVEQYGKMIINLIVSELTPDQVCKSLGLCTSAKVVLF